VRILIVGLSTRAIAESAVRGGYPVFTLDYFGDRDQKELVENYSLKRDCQLGFSAEALLTASRRLLFEAVAYTSNLENHPAVVEGMARGRVLLGNTPQTLGQVRHWPTLRSFCREEGIPFPTTVLAGEEIPIEKGRRWLCKPVKSGGGHGITFWSGARKAFRAGYLLQEYVEGRPCSAAFVANGRTCVLIGLTEQLIGRKELGAVRARRRPRPSFTWCGNILPLELPPPERIRVLAVVRTMAEKFIRRFGLVGVNGVDFVLSQDGVPYLVEVNPRYCASMELMERAYGLPVFDLHFRAITAGELPDFDLALKLAGGPFYGKGILYAEKDAVAPETRSWLERGIKDVPFSGESLTRGSPVCTILAQGPTQNACYTSLLAQAEALKGEIYA
jgi:predicted ATP-grasp superfamily ATP-dependent carboligase